MTHVMPFTLAPTHRPAQYVYTILPLFRKVFFPTFNHFIFDMLSRLILPLRGRVPCSCLLPFSLGLCGRAIYSTSQQRPISFLLWYMASVRQLSPDTKQLSYYHFPLL